MSLYRDRNITVVFELIQDIKFGIRERIMLAAIPSNYDISASSPPRHSASAAIASFNASSRDSVPPVISTIGNVSVTPSAASFSANKSYTASARSSAKLTFFSLSTPKPAPGWPVCHVVSSSSDAKPWNLIASIVSLTPVIPAQRQPLHRPRPPHLPSHCSSGSSSNRRAHIIFESYQYLGLSQHEIS